MLPQQPEAGFPNRSRSWQKLRPCRPPGAPGLGRWYMPPKLRITPQGYALGEIPLIENPIQLAVVPEVNGAGIMLSGCDLLATVVYLLHFIIMYLNKLAVWAHCARYAMAATLYPRQ